MRNWKKSLNILFISSAWGFLLSLSSKLATAQTPIPNPAPTTTTNVVPAPISPGRAMPSTPGVLAPTVGSNYILGPGDRIKVEFFEIPEISGEYTIIPNGVITMPRIGLVDLTGMTIQQATDFLRQKYARFVNRPILTVGVIQTRPIRVVVAGEVQRPGVYTLTNSETLQTGDQAKVVAGYPTLTAAIQKAGGIRQLADIRQIQIQRQSPRSQAAIAPMTFNLWELIRSGDLNQDLALLDGDSIFVPEAKNLSPEEALRISAANISPENITINVVGEIRNPGSIRLPANTPLNQAILSAGGFTPRSLQTVVELVRLNQNGTVERRDIKIDFNQSLASDANPPLQNFDAIVVRPNRMAGFSDRFNQVSPLLSPLFLLRGFLGF